MGKRKTVALLTIIALGRPTFSVGKLLVRSISSASSTGVQLAQKKGAAGGCWAGERVSGSSGGAVEASTRRPLVELASGACTGESAGDSCSFTTPKDQTVTGTCTTVPEGFVCVPSGAILHRETGDNGSQPRGDR